MASSPNLLFFFRFLQSNFTILHSGTREGREKSGKVQIEFNTSVCYTVANAGKEMPMIETWTVTIPQLTGDTPRRAYAYVPDYFGEDESQRFPVLYMFDGHNVFFDEDATYGKSWGLGDYLQESGLPLIVAAVECNRGEDNGRLSEYSPFTFSERGMGKFVGRGRTTMNWFVKEFKPYIDYEYPTLPGREDTFIAGSSMGGLMSLYALLEYNRFFSRAAALSPSLWVAPARLERMINGARLDPDTHLYMDYGARELGNHSAMSKGFGHFTALLMEKRINVTSRIVPDGDHSEGSWERQIPFFMDALFYGKDY